MENEETILMQARIVDAKSERREELSYLAAIAFCNGNVAMAEQFLSERELV